MVNNYPILRWSSARLQLCFLAVTASNNCLHALQPPFLSSWTKLSSRTVERIATTSPNVKVEQTQQTLEEQARRAHRQDSFNALFVEVPESPTPQACTVPPADNPYHNNFPLPATLPVDFPAGAFLRIGPNGAAADEGFLDGDGFINCVVFPPRASNQAQTKNQDSAVLFTATYVDTLGRQTERRAAMANGNESNNNKNRPRYRGTLGGAPRGWPLLATLVRNAVTLQTSRPQKDTCNTALALHGNTLLALMEQSLPTELRVQCDGRVETLCASSHLKGAIPQDDVVTGGNLGAHGRTCSLTGERIHVSYAPSQKPYARVDIFGMEQQQQQLSEANGATSATGFQLKRSIPIHDLNVPVMMHDLALTANYVVVLDFPLTIRPGRMLRDQFPVAYEPEHGARIGLVPRHTTNNDVDKNTAPVIQWFDVDPCVVLHTVQAYETKDHQVVLQALRSVPTTTNSYITSYTTAFLHEWVMDLDSGTVQEQCLNPNELVEFPVVDARFHGKRADSAFAIHVSSIGGPIATLSTPREGILIDGLVKFALVDNDETGMRKGDVVDRFVLPEHWYTVSEPTLVPKIGSKENSSPGGVYVIMVATHVPKGLRDLERIGNGKTLTSHVLVLDGDCLGAGPVWVAETPQHLAYGLHSEFIPWDSLQE